MARKPLVVVTSAQMPEVRRLLAQLPSFLTEDARAEFETVLSRYKTEMVARSTSGPVYRQTGRLARSWGYKVDGDRLSTLSSFIASFSDVKAAILEQGGMVYPKGGSRSWIFIPTDKNRKFNGTAIRTPRQVLDAGGRYYNRTKETRAGQKIIFAVIQGKTSLAWNLLLNAEDEPMFIMAKHATYVPLLGFISTGDKYEKQIVPRLADLVVEYWKTAA